MGQRKGNLTTSKMGEITNLFSEECYIFGVVFANFVWEQWLNHLNIFLPEIRFCVDHDFNVRWKLLLNLSISLIVLTSYYQFVFSN